MNITNSIFIVLQQIYFTVAAIKVYQYRKKFEANFSDFGKTRIVYAQTFILLIWIFNLITISLYATLPMTIVEYVILPLVLTGIYFFILYYTFHHHSVFTEQSYKELIASSYIMDFNSKKNKELSNTLQDAQILLLAQQIDDFLMEYEPYTNVDFNLNLLSKQMEIAPSKISSAITYGFKKTFYDLINEKRVDKTIMLLKNYDKDADLEQIGLKAGFNNKASLYRAFKKHTNATPLTFLNKIKGNELS